MPGNSGFCVNMIHSTINFGTSTPISRHKKRLDRQLSLYQTIAFNMAENGGFEPPQLLHPNGFRNHPLQPLE